MSEPAAPRWTPEQVRLISLYGTCEICGAPRDVGMAVRPDGSLHTEMHCTASPCEPPPPPGSDALLAWAKTAEWKFASYYKYSFTFAARAEGFTATATVGGDANDIYKFEVKAGVPMTWGEIACRDEPYLTVTDLDGKVIYEG